MSSIAQTAEGEKILIVDDDENIAELISLYLLKECFDTMMVHDGEEALAAFDSYSPNLVLLDLMLPGASGEEVLKEIRKHGRLPVIVLTAKDSIDDKIGVLTDGADDYITKPFEIREVLARIQVQQKQADDALKTLDSIKGDGWTAMVADIRGEALLSKGDKQGARDAWSKGVASGTSPALREMMQMKINNLSS